MILTKAISLINPETSADEVSQMRKAGKSDAYIRKQITVAATMVCDALTDIHVHDTTVDDKIISAGALINRIQMALKRLKDMDSLSAEQQVYIGAVLMVIKDVILSMPNVEGGDTSVEKPEANQSSGEGLAVEIPERKDAGAPSRGRI